MTNTSPGVSDSEIRVGVLTIKRTAKLAAIAGTQLDPGDFQAFARAAGEHINERGGVLGRRLALDIQEIDAVGDFKAEEEAAVKAWVGNGGVFAAVAIHNGVTPTLVSRLAEQRTILLSSVYYIADEKLMEEHGDYLFAPTTPHLGRAARAYVASVIQQGFFTGATAVGLLRHDTPVASRVADEVVKPALARVGVKIHHEVALDTSSPALVSARMPEVVTGFKQAGVDRVLSFLDGFEFAALAERLQYRPRYAIHTQSAPQLLTIIAPKDQLRGAIGIGWMPAYDVYADDAPAQNPARARALEVFAKAGASIPSRIAEGIALSFYDYLSFLKIGLERAQSISPEGFRAAVEGLGTSFESSLALSTRFGQGRHDGAGAWRPLAYDEAAGRFRYTGEAVELD